jgi:hypothetical protein
VSCVVAGANDSAAGRLRRPTATGLSEVDDFVLVLDVLIKIRLLSFSELDPSSEHEEERVVVVNENALPVVRPEQTRPSLSHPVVCSPSKWLPTRSAARTGISRVSTGPLVPEMKVHGVHTRRRIPN